MATTISDGMSSVTPILVVEYVHRRQTRTIVHDVIGSGVPDVTLRPAGTRSGRLSAVLTDRGDVATLDAMLASAAVLTIASDDEPLLDGLRLVVAEDDPEVRLDGARTWVVTWTYREIP